MPVLGAEKSRSCFSDRIFITAAKRKKINSPQLLTPGSRGDYYTAYPVECAFGYLVRNIKCRIAGIRHSSI